jgi:hypothetical protein
MPSLTKVIKKSQVIKALKTEKLKRGQWFYINDYVSTLPPTLTCKVCAVGAVLRQVSFVKWAIKNNVNWGYLGDSATNNSECLRGDDAKEEIELELNNKNYLAALSNYYESGHTRKQCIEWVKKNFPKQFKLTINTEE